MNTNNSSSADVHRDPNGLVITEVCILSLLMFIIIIGNILVISCLLNVKEMKTVTGIFLLNLAVTDLGVGVVSIPLSIASNVKQFFVHEKWFCILNGSGLMLFLTSSVLTLAAISFQKYVTVDRKANIRFSKKHASCCIAVIWILSVVFTVGPIIGWAEYTYSYGGHQCAPYTYNTAGYSYFVLLLLIFFLLPGLTMSYCYARLYFFTRHYIRTVRLRAETNPEQTSKPWQSISDTRMIHTLLIVMFAFVLCWLPCGILYFIKFSGQHITIHLEGVVVMLAYGNSALNPIIYALRHKAFRKWTRKMIICLRENNVASEDIIMPRR